MKLRTSFFNAGVLKKDITRFAPLWAVYLVGGLLVMLSTISQNTGMGAARELSQTIGPLAVVNLIYAAVCAQMLFGDLFQTRMCNALHAMPLRRECWFGTHVVAGLAFSIVPHVIGAVCFTLFLGEAWFVAFIWLLAMVLEYLFFFGLAVFSIFCVGNRVAQLAIYGILNFGSMIIGWFIDTIYAPLLYGIQIPRDPFLIFCPMGKMLGTGYVQFEAVKSQSGFYSSSRWAYQGIGEGWDYLTICAILGVALLGLGLLLYRRRKLETAGNFIAVKPVEPIFAVVFTLCAGAVFAAFSQLFYNSGYVVYLVVGLILGWFVGQMLLRRTVKVFQWKTFLKLGILGLVMGASLLITSLDPLGLTTWLPDQEAVAKVEINTGSSIRPGSDMYVLLDTPEEIAMGMEMHETIAAAGDQSYYSNGRVWNIVIQYTMKDGGKVSRYYKIYAGTSGWIAFQKLYSTPESVLGYTDWDNFCKTVGISFEGYDLEELCENYEKKYEVEVDHKAIRQELLEALKKDCEAGTLTKDAFMEYKEYVFSLELRTGNNWRYLAVQKTTVNTAAWYERYEDIINMAPNLK